MTHSVLRTTIGLGSKISAFPRRRLIAALAIPAAAGFTALQAHAQFTFDPRVSYTVGTEPDGVAAADFNGDTFPDLAVVVDNQDRVQILLNNGNGTFSLGASVRLPASSSPGDIVAGNLDTDTDIDLAVALKDFNQVQVLLGAGNGTFVLGQATGTGGDEPVGLDIADFDNDNDLDLAMANRRSTVGTVMRNSGNATFISTQLPVGGEPRAAAFGNWAAGPALELAITDHDGRRVALFAWNGANWSSTGTISVGTQRRPEGIDSADLNGDLVDDLVVATNGQNNLLNDVSVFLANGAGGFGPVAHYPTGGLDTSEIVAADFNCDGLFDVATGNNTSNNVSVLANLGGGVFGAATILASGNEPEDLAVADFDGTGSTDIAVSGKLSNDVSVHLNRTCTGGGAPTLSVFGPCPGLITLEVRGATPGGRVAFIAARGTGSAVIPPSQPCPGTVLGLNATAFLLGTATADGAGVAQFSGNAPASACGGVFLQGLDVTTCTTTEVEGL